MYSHQVCPRVRSARNSYLEIKRDYNEIGDLKNIFFFLQCAIGPFVIGSW